MTEIKPVIFREYDIRGTVDVDLSEDLAFLLGIAFGEMTKDAGGKELAIGYDCRLSSPGYANALARGISASGLKACLTGMGPTPQLYYAIHKHSFSGGIQVTGSHNPPDMNGFKICKGPDALSGTQIQEIKERMIAIQKKGLPTAQTANIRNLEVQQQYIDELIANCKPHMGKRKLKVVVDAGNGVGGMVGPATLKALGVEVIELFCEPDGTFPNHHPDPTVLENIETLIQKVKETKADFGIGWDGDADRIGVIDESGQILFGDMLLLVFSRQLLKEVPGATIIGDVKCSSRLFDDINAHGGKALMWKTGHSLIKKKLKEVGGALGGEMSGHIAFKHRYYGFDDALYSSCRLVELFSKAEGPFSSMLAGLPPAVSTPEMRLDCPEAIKFKIAELAKSAFPEYETNTIDGVRVQFPEGWGLVRASNTQPILVLRFEAKTQELLSQYKGLVLERLENIKKKLGA